jgi:hypothetical protein
LSAPNSIALSFRVNVFYYWLVVFFPSGCAICLLGHSHSNRVGFSTSQVSAACFDG